MASVVQVRRRRRSKNPTPVINHRSDAKRNLRYEPS
jgi:hypothetical protein